MLSIETTTASTTTPRATSIRPRRFRSNRLAAAVVASLATLTACGSGGGSSVADSSAATTTVADTTTVAATTTTTEVHSLDGPFAVGIRTVTFVDTTRGTPANFTAPAQPTRTLETLIAYPAVGPAHPYVFHNGTPDPHSEHLGAPPAKGTFPLIVYAHGFGGGYESVYLHYWAEAGYVVIAPSFPLTRHDAPGGPSFDDVANEPGDVSFVLDQMAHLPPEDADIQEIVNGQAVGVMGASLGAPVALDVGYDSVLRDPRVRAVAAISGTSCCPLLGGAGVGRPAGTYFTGPSVPLMLVHGTADPIAPYAKSSEEFGLAPAPKFFVTLEGARQIEYGTWAGIAAQSMIDFFDRYLKNDPAGLTRLNTDANIDGFASLQEDASGP